MGLATIQDLDDRRIEYQDVTQARARIEDASADARVCVAPDLDDVDAPDQGVPAVDQGVPAAVVAIVVKAVERVLANPVSVTQENLGDYSYSAGSGALGGTLLTAKECRRIRKAVGHMGAGSIGTTVALPVQPSERFDGTGGLLL